MFIFHNFETNQKTNNFLPKNCKEIWLNADLWRILDAESPGVNCDDFTNSITPVLNNENLADCKFVISIGWKTKPGQLYSNEDARRCLEFIQNNPTFLDFEITLPLRASLFTSASLKTHYSVFDHFNTDKRINWSITFWRSSDELTTDCIEALKNFESMIKVPIYYDLD